MNQATAERPPGTSATDRDDTGSGGLRRRVGLVFVLLGLVALVVFWTYALFFAPKEAVNRIGDRAWAGRAERICAAATERRELLMDDRRLDTDDPALLAERGDLIDRATDIVEQMLGDVLAVEPADEKGQAIVPQWAADYETYLGNRREFADRLRAGRNEPFREAAVEGIPISDKLEQFASDNEMASCAPPRDTSN